MKTKGIDWTTVDWSLNNGELARSLGVHLTGVKRMRKRLAIPAATTRGRCAPETRGRRKPISDLDYEFAWKPKGFHKSGGRIWSQAVKRYLGDACKLCGYLKPPVINHSHHIVPISQGGKNSIRNGIVLCSRCHDEVHAGLLSLA